MAVIKRSIKGAPLTHAEMDGNMDEILLRATKSGTVLSDTLTVNTDALEVTSAKRILIGTTADDGVNKLQVNGSTFINGNITLGAAAGDITTVPDLKALQVTTPSRASIRPSLLLDFANSKVLDPRITFTRASTATYYDQFGVMRTAAINAPRFSHDPVTGESLGLLMEETRTNLLLNSDTLNTQNVTVSAATYTLTIHGTGSVVLSGAYSGNLAGTGTTNRVSLVFTPSAGTLTLTVSGTVTMAQLEYGAFPTSYIPTTSTQVTRASDNASMTANNFSNWYRSDEGTIYFNGKTNSPTTARTAFIINDNTYSNRVQSLPAYLGLLVVTSGVVIANISMVTCYDNTAVAMVYKTNDFAISRNGSYVSTDTSGDVPVVNQLRIGDRASDAENWCGTIKKLAYYPKRLTDVELQGLTTP